jgi:hypothetical protein
MNGDRKIEEPTPVATPSPAPRIESNGTARVGETVMPPVSSGAKTDQPGPGTLLIGVLFWAGLGLFWALRSEWGQEFLGRWWWAFTIGFALITGWLLYRVVQRWYVKAAAPKQTALVVFVVIPLLLVLIGGVGFLSRPYQVVVLRVVFLIAVCLLPALIYYLFIASRQISLLNDYFLNLARLGLLERQSPTDGARAECRVRVLNYVQKFEALYGPLPPELENSLTEADDPLAVLVTPQWRRSVSSGIVKIFTAETAIPVVLATVLTAVGWLLALPPTGIDGDWVGTSSPISLWTNAFIIQETPVIYAFLGAYFFSLQMLFRRYVREDLRKSAYLAVALRIILAVVGTWAAVTAITTIGKIDLNSKYLLVIGFVIGVFPRIAWQFIQGASKALMRKLRMSAVLPSMESRLPLSDLDGLTVWHEARLEEEDIENVPNMASAEIVDLMISTRFPPERIIDWVDQAILFTYLGPDKKDQADQDSSRRELLRRQGIRTATSFIHAFDSSQSRDDKDVVEKILSDASGSHVRSLLDAIGTDSNVSLVCAWRKTRVRA